MMVGSKLHEFAGPSAHTFCPSELVDFDPPRIAFTRWTADTQPPATSGPRIEVFTQGTSNPCGIVGVWKSDTSDRHLAVFPASPDDDAEYAFITTANCLGGRSPFADPNLAAFGFAGALLDQADDEYLLSFYFWSGNNGRCAGTGIDDGAAQASCQAARQCPWIPQRAACAMERRPTSASKMTRIRSFAG
ncbi:MAG: hypothetical protein WCA30_01545, partial [Dermatophilaceae bacterium]